MTDHAKFSPSAAHRWMVCPASLRLEAELPDTSSEFAREGTAAHYLGERCLSEKVDAHTLIGEHMVVDGGPAIVVDEVMAQYVQEYLDYVRGVPGRQYVETRVRFDHVVPGGFGTVDALVVDDVEQRLHVIDLKYGQGVRVDADENPQLQLYALGALKHFAWVEEIEFVTCTIVQPRLDHVSEWETTPEALAVFAEAVREAAELALSDDPPFRPSQSACRFCKLSGNCQAQADAVASVVFDDLGEPHDVAAASLDDLAAWLDQAGLVTDWVSAVKSRAFMELQNGHPVPGWKLVAGRANRRWGDEDDAAIALESELGDDAWSRSLISPAQAEKLLGKKHALLETHVVKPQGKPTLAPESDKRQALPTSAEAAFDDLD